MRRMRRLERMRRMRRLCIMYKKEELNPTTVDSLNWNIRPAGELRSREPGPGFRFRFQTPGEISLFHGIFDFGRFD